MILLILLTLFLVFLNGFFVAAEFAIVKVRESQLEVQAKLGHRSAILGKTILSNLDGYLAATQLGITLASLGLGWIGEPVVSKLIVSGMHTVGMQIHEDLAHKIALPVAFAIITVLHIVFGELAPKSVAIQRSERMTLLVAYPLRFFYLIFRPFIWVLNGFANVVLRMIGISSVHGAELHSSEELKYLVEQGKDTGMIEESDYRIIKNAFDFSERTAKEVLIPRVQVVALDVNDFNEKELERVIDEGFSRIPCYEDTLDNVVGVVYLKDLLVKRSRGEQIHLSELVRPVLMIPGSKRIGILLRDFQVRHQQIAVVLSEYGGMDGIVTMEDILEELVGQIQDEYDNESHVVEKTGERIYSCRAFAFLNEINEFLPHPIEKEGGYETLSGKLIDTFGRVPNTNEKITFDEYEFTVLKKNRSAIAMVQIRDLREAPPIH